MEPLLRPWLNAVDDSLRALVRGPNGDRAPRWREQLYGGDSGNGISNGSARPERQYIDLEQNAPLLKQRKLREAFELFALALQIDEAAFMDALARGMPWITRAWTYEPFAVGEKLQLRLPVDTRSHDEDFFSAFLLHDVTSSDAFKQTQRELRALDARYNKDDVAVAFDLQVQLEIAPGMQTPAKAARMLRHINREVFHVTKVYVILSPKLETSALVDLVDVYRAVHTFRDTAEVETHFEVPAAPMDRTKLIRWKWFLDLTARKAFESVSGEAKHQWIVAAVFGEPGLDPECCAKATTTAAFLSALAHSRDHVTSASVVMALQDAGRDRAVRAKYIGYLFRSSVLTKLSFRDQYLSRDDVANILAIYGMPTRGESLRALHAPSWHTRSVLDDKNATKYLPLANEVIGVMGDTARDDTVDVLLASYGQCGVKRSLLNELRPSLADADAAMARGLKLKTLELLFLNEAHTAEGIIRLAVVVGRPIQELRIELEQGLFQLLHIFMLLEACLKLRKLSIKQVALKPRDDQIPFTPPSPREPLESLTIQLDMDSDDPSGVVGFCKLIGNYAPTLKEIELIAPDLQEPFPAEVAAMEILLGHKMLALQKLRIMGIQSQYIRSLWDRNRPGLRHVETLLLEGVLWDKPDWTAFLAALSDASHPLAQSVRTLHLLLNGFEKTTELHTMLQKNVGLSNVAINLPQGLRTSSNLIKTSQATNGRSVLGLKEPLPPRHRAALLSALAAKNIRMETQNVRSIFEFAAMSETRNVRVSLVGTREF